MKKEQRVVFLSLVEEIKCPLCLVCQYSEYESDGCCEGYGYCVHPIEKLCEQREEGLDVGKDCWGFRPDMSVSLLADLVGAVISQGYQEWAFNRYSETSLTVYGRSWEESGEKSGKVRIGHDGRPNKTTGISM